MIYLSSNSKQYFLKSMRTHHMMLRFSSQNVIILYLCMFINCQVTCDICIAMITYMKYVFMASTTFFIMFQVGSENETLVHTLVNWELASKQLGQSM